MYIVFVGYTIQTTQRLYFSIENKRKFWVLPFQVDVMKDQSKMADGGSVPLNPFQGSYREKPD